MWNINNKLFFHLKQVHFLKYYLLAPLLAQFPLIFFSLERSLHRMQMLGEWRHSHLFEGWGLLSPVSKFCNFSIIVIYYYFTLKFWICNIMLMLGIALILGLEKILERKNEGKDRKRQEERKWESIGTKESCASTFLVWGLDLFHYRTKPFK